MIILHCTQKAQKRLKVTPQTDLPETGSKLGNWYCNEFTFNRSKYLLFTSEQTLLPIITSTKDAKNTEEMLERFRQRFFKIMLGWEVPQAILEHELEQVQDIVIAKTQSRSVLGSMNDFVHCTTVMCDCHGIAPDGPEVFVQLARMPIGAMKYNNPKKATLDLLVSLK